MIIWSEVSQTVLDIAEELIRRYHPNLKEARIGFIFRSEAGVSRGNLVIAHAEKVNPKYQTLAIELDFLIWIAKDIWDKYETDQCKALIDHQLCHCLWEDGEAKMRGHDFEEFTEIVDRWGMWNFSLLRSSKAFEKALQLDLGLELQPRGAVMAVQPDAVQLPMTEEG